MQGAGPDHGKPRWSATRRTVLVAVIALLVFLGSVWDLSSELRRSPFHPDESRWINRAYYLRETLDPLGPSWSDRYLIRGQPPMGSYVTGLGLLAQGRDLTTNGPWDFQYGFESNVTWNVTRGNMPGEADLMATRRWNMAISALTATLLFLIVTRLTNIAGGIATAVALTANPLNQYLATLGTADAVFTFFVACSVLAGMHLAKRPTWWRAVLLALALAAGASTKLSPLGIAAGLGAGGAVLLFDPWLRQHQVLGKAWSVIARNPRGTERRLGIMLLTLPVLVPALFVLSYPYLWPAPIGRTRILLDFRRYEMDQQASFWPQAAIESRREALSRTWTNLNDRYSSSDRLMTELGNLFGMDWSGVKIDLYLAAPGILLLVYLAWRHGLASEHAIAAAITGGQSLLILAALGVDFNRYYLPLLLASALGIGVFAGCLVDWVLAFGRASWLGRNQPAAHRARNRLATVAMLRKFQS